MHAAAGPGREGCRRLSHSCQLCGETEEPFCAGFSFRPRWLSSMPISAFILAGGHHEPDGRRRMHMHSVAPMAYTAYK